MALRASPADSSESVPPIRKLRILVADDNRDTVLTLMMLLRDEGHEVQGVYDGEQAMRVAKQSVFDVVILDVQMPGKTGYEIAKELRASLGSKTPLLIAISGKYVGGSDKLLAQMVGFDEHLPKPCDPHRLVGMIKTLTSGGKRY